MLLYFINLPKDVEVQKKLTALHIKEWLQQDVFHFRWWLLIALILIFWIVWWILIDKSRTLEICLFTALAIIIVLGINEYGEELTLWDYPTDVIPIFPPLSSINLIILPLIYSLVYQYFKTGKSFFIASTIVSALLCFVLEPILVWAGLFQLLHWQYLYNLLMFIVLSHIIRITVIKVYKITEKYNG